jgi:hypothetical protein
VTLVRNLTPLRLYRFGLFVALVVVALILPSAGSP